MNEYRRRPFLAVGLAVLAGSVIVSCGALSPSPPSGQPPPASTPAGERTETGSSSPEQAGAAEETGEEEGWNTIETFAGEANASTPSFHVSAAKWRISWTIDTGYPEYAVLDILVYPEDTRGLFVDRISHAGDDTSHTAYVDGGRGDYWLKVVAANLRSWTVRVEEPVTTAVFSPVQITRINYEGRDYMESAKAGYEIVEADEYVEIKNRGDCPQIIGGWRLKNVSKGGPSFIFPVHMPCSCSWFDDHEACVEECVPPSPCTLAPHHSIRVYTGEVHEESGGFCFHYPLGDIWDNKQPDVVVLYNSRGEEVSRRSYVVSVEGEAPASEQRPRSR